MYRTRAPASFWVDIRSSCLVHERGCEAQGAASSQFLSTSCPVFRQAVLPAEGSPTVKQLKEVLRETAGISATTNAVYMARKKVERSCRSRYEASFRALSPWIRDFCISNAGSGGDVEEEVEGTWKGTFKRACLVSGAMAHMVRHCGLRVLGQVADQARRSQSFFRVSNRSGTPHEPLGNLTLGLSRWFQGQVMVVESWLSDGSNIPIAAGVFAELPEGGGAETEENARYLWGHVKGSELGDWMSESRGKLTEYDLIPATSFFVPVVTDGSSCEPGRDGTEDLFWKAQAATSWKEWDSCMTELAGKNGVAHEFLEEASHAHQRPSRHAGDVDFVRSYGISKLAGKSLFDLDVSPLDLFQQLTRSWSKIVREELKRKDQLLSPDSPATGISRLFITQEVSERYAKNVRRSAMCRIRAGSTSEYAMTVMEEVKDDPEASAKPLLHSVSLVHKTCSPCGFWHQMQQPCEHAICAARAMGWADGGEAQLIRRLFAPQWLADDFILAASSSRFRVVIPRTASVEQAAHGPRPPPSPSNASKLETRPTRKKRREAASEPRELLACQPGQRKRPRVASTNDE
ncbi:hypothetical protein GUITHDRAFT_142472 [Guillardia theta CCMP2712]|uniref:SWIM-type domain-containing protein n=1 Tax=Guillardia theta (strain CCMP2712) TaxID=905079 RepID=L1IYF7_GUITC|nr:hypothetical protein GUITHDRAFT_142472 [Guillardia theta CCMP2712]EKX40855.1 hypothetical protein GUITHDRAFT_142472 [Guillardia theta CCMP2712]|eukprot:XP_005827835.1 hypothetical protein GUITHDRAFT_142472 [Guillardia theta CCMP2712]